MTNIQPVSASDIPSRVGGDIPRALTTDEIYTIVDKFAEAAKRAVTAGFDAVEIQAGHGYLLNQFLSPTTNDRTDEFGGSKENRARFTTLVLKAVRETVGENIPIFLGISADELAEGGNTLDDTLEIVEYFKDYVDVFDVSAGLTCSIQYQYCLLYTSDAADEEDSVDLGGRRIIKQKNKRKKRVKKKHQYTNKNKKTRS